MCTCVYVYVCVCRGEEPSASAVGRVSHGRERKALSCAQTEGREKRRTRRRRRATPATLNFLGGRCTLSSMLHRPPPLLPIQVVQLALPKLAGSE